MQYGSVCSGIEAATQSWHPLGWTPVFFSEIEKFPSAVLAHHYGSNMPGDELTGNGVPNYGDMTNFKEWPDHAIDVLVGGTPCQSFSVAGLRKGLDDPRGNLMLTFGAIAQRYKPKWIVWENVPGVLSSDGGRDFGTFLRLLGECGYGFAYRVLDAQFVRVDGLGRAVPQRRRRVFVVGCLGDWRSAAAVLSEPEGLSGNIAPRRKAGEGFAGGTLRSSGGGSDVDHARAGHLIPQGTSTARMVAFGEYKDDGTASTVKSRDYKDATDLIAFNSREDPEVTGDRSGPLGAGSPQSQAIAFKPSHFTRGKDGAPSEVVPPMSADADRGDQEPVVTAKAYDLRGREGGAQFEGPHDTANIRAADGGSSRSYVQQDWAVRRLTPRECERLQGFPDDYTRIPWRNKVEDNCPDGPRYKALGNSMAVNCMRWIGQRIEMIEELQKEAAQ